MQVFLCDDDPISLKCTEEILSQYEKTSGLEISIRDFTSGEGLLAYQGEEPDVVFMDIVMDGIQGIDAAAEVNQRWPNCFVAYLTDYLVFATDVYRTEHVFFVLKEQFPERVGEIIGKILQKISLRKRTLVFNTGTQTILLAPQEIKLFERRLRQTIIVTENEEYQTAEKLSDIIKKLPEGEYSRCHNSYIISFQAVRSMQADSFCMKDGTVISISRAYRKSVRFQFEHWAMRQL